MQVVLRLLELLVHSWRPQLSPSHSAWCNLWSVCLCKLKLGSIRAAASAADYVSSHLLFALHVVSSPLKRPIVARLKAYSALFFGSILLQGFKGFEGSLLFCVFRDTEENHNVSHCNLEPFYGPK